MGFTPAYERTALDWAFPTSSATDHVAYSVNGSTETTILARTAVGASGWAAATTPTQGQPSRKANSATLTTAAATGAGTITHWAIFSAASGGVQKLDWEPLTASKTLAVGESGTWEPGSLTITMD